MHLFRRLFGVEYMLPRGLRCGDMRITHQQRHVPGIYPAGHSVRV